VATSRGNPPDKGAGASNGKADDDGFGADEPLDPVLPPAEAGAERPLTVDELRQRLKEAEAALEASAQLRDSHEKYLRAAADLENYRKRAMREREEAERFGITSLLKELLPVVDNLDRALDHLSESEAHSALGQGVAATRRIFEDVLGKFGVKAFSAKGTAFDPNLHEAMQRIPTDEVAPGMVAQELLRGYTLRDRLIRPALVSVAVAPADEQGEEPA
jgi:molecular chaperone GrpE